MTKMTYVSAIDFVLQLMNENMFEGVEDEKAVAMERLEALKAQLEKRNNGKRKPTKTQKENEALKAEVVEFLHHTLQGMQCKDIASQFEVSGQKMSALLTQLVKAEVVEKYAEKRVTYFKAVDVDEAQFLDGEVTF